MNFSSNFRGLSLLVEMAPFCLKKHERYFICVHVDVNVYSRLRSLRLISVGNLLWAGIFAISTR